MATGGVGVGGGDYTSLELPLEQKLEQARNYKLQGNSKYKEKSYKAAISKYHRGLLYLRGIENAKKSALGGLIGQSAEYSVPEDIQTEVTSLKVDCYNNLAACLLQSENPNYDKVVQYCNNVLELNPKKVKAMYRKGVALYSQKRIDRALESFQEALQYPEGQKDPNIKRYISLCEKEMVKQDEKMKKTYKGMFEKLAQEPTEELIKEGT